MYSSCFSAISISRCRSAGSFMSSMSFLPCSASSACLVLASGDGDGSSGVVYYHDADERDHEVGGPVQVFAGRDPLVVTPAEAGVAGHVRVPSGSGVLGVELVGIAFLVVGVRVVDRVGVVVVVLLGVLLFGLVGVGVGGRLVLLLFVPLVHRRG